MSEFLLGVPLAYILELAVHTPVDIVSLDEWFGLVENVADEPGKVVVKIGYRWRLKTVECLRTYFKVFAD